MCAPHVGAFLPIVCIVVHVMPQTVEPFRTEIPRSSRRKAMFDAVVRVWQHWMVPPEHVLPAVCVGDLVDVVREGPEVGVDVVHGVLVVVV